MKHVSFNFPLDSDPANASVNLDQWKLVEVSVTLRNRTMLQIWCYFWHMHAGTVHVQGH